MPPALARGEISGGVAMTEPEAGSDVGNLSTTATAARRLLAHRRPQAVHQRRQRRLRHRPRARRARDEGSRWAGLFVVPRCVPVEGGERENYKVERAEHKFTIRGSPTCSLVFEAARARSWVEIGQGWRHHALHERVAHRRRHPGFGIAQAALVAAQDYAARRVQMAKPIREHPMVAEMLLEMETTVAGLRALWMEAAVAYDLVQRSRPPRRSEGTPSAAATRRAAAAERCASSRRW